MKNWETGEQYPCGNCKRVECNGCYKKRVDNPVVQMKEKREFKGNLAFKEFMAGIVERKEVRDTVDALPAEFDVEYFRERGRVGGKKTAERGSSYYKEIRKKRKAYVKRGVAQAEGGVTAG